MTFIFLFSISLAAQPGSPQESAKSVVKIRSIIKGSESSATGFVWSASNQVVTALHAVAGAERILVYSESRKDETEAKIIAVLKEADLALLQLTNDLQLASLKITDREPQYRDEHYIWGYPWNLPEMKEDDIRFSMGLNSSPTLKSIFATEKQYKKVLGEQDYPQWNSKIIRLSSTIQPGHSGAPIFDKNGRVVGIADGGLREGVARINWAIPASAYLPVLSDSKDVIPGKASVQNLLFSHKTEQREIRIDVKDTNGVVNDSDLNTVHNLLRLAWSAPLGEIITTESEEDLSYFTTQLNIIQNETGIDLRQEVIDIYEDSETGATIAVPANTEIVYDQENRTLEARTADNRIEMIVQITAEDSWDSAMEAMKEFDAYLIGEEEWQQYPEEEDRLEIDNETQYRYESKSRIQHDDESNMRNRLITTMIIDQTDFLGTAVIINDMETLSGNDLKALNLMTVCSELANFSIE